MRAIALAILLAGAGVEYAILKVADKEIDYTVAMGIATFVMLVGFIYCLISGI